MIETQRLILAPFSRADVQALFAIRGDPQAMTFWDWPQDASLEETRRAADFILSEVERQTALYWTARRRDDGMFVGIFDLSDLLSGAAELGFMIVRALEGHGYAFEATSALVAQARKLRTPRLKARIHSGNLRSLRLLQRLGFSLQREADIEIRPGVTQRCAFFELEL